MISRFEFLNASNNYESSLGENRTEPCPNALSTRGNRTSNEKKSTKNERHHRSDRLLDFKPNLEPYLSYPSDHYVETQIKSVPTDSTKVLID